MDRDSNGHRGPVFYSNGWKGPAPTLSNFQKITLIYAAIIAIFLAGMVAGHALSADLGPVEQGLVAAPKDNADG